MFTQKFQAYVCPGDSITCEVDGFTIHATLHHDSDTSPEDYDCYSDSDKAAWSRDEWFFSGVVLSVEREGVTLSDHAASLWAIDANHPDGTSTYLAEVANELLPEAMDVARDTLRKLCACVDA